MTPGISLADANGLTWTRFPAGENGPMSVDDVIIRAVEDSETLTAHGHVINVVPTDGMKNRRTTWPYKRRTLRRQQDFGAFALAGC